MVTASGTTNPVKRSEGMRVVLVLVVAGFFVVAVYRHLFNVNSEYFYQLPWQWIASRRIYPVLIPLGIPFFIGQMIYLRRPALLWMALGLVTLSTFGLIIGGAVVQRDPSGFSRISDEVKSRWTTGYFESAAKLVDRPLSMRQVLRRYPTLLQYFYLHPRQKPPGTILFEMAIIRILGEGTSGAMASGLLIAAIASLSVITTYKFVADVTQDRAAGFFAASYLALCPSLLFFFPDFDSCFANLTAILAVLWAAALRQDRARWSVALGVAYALASSITYLVGVLPLFLGGFAIIQWRSDPRCDWTRIIKHLAIALIVFVAFYAILWALTGFNPIATFLECKRQLDILWSKLLGVYHYRHHSLPWTFFTDLYDFALGSGWISFVLAGFYFRSAWKEGWTMQAWLALVAVGQFVVIAMIGLLQTETSRIWIFMYPMLMLPIGLELARWRPGARIAVFAALLLLAILMCQSMEFMSSAM
jgi:hypothetical protein